MFFFFIEYHAIPHNYNEVYGYFDFPCLMGGICGGWNWLWIVSIGGISGFKPSGSTTRELVCLRRKFQINIIKYAPPPPLKFL
jgi:hypothetical protein